MLLQGMKRMWKIPKDMEIRNFDIEFMYRNFYWFDEKIHGRLSELPSLLIVSFETSAWKRKRF